jgi:hypothetical protein
MDKNIKDSGKMEIEMEKVYIFIQMAGFTMVNIKMISVVVKEL